MQFKLQYTKYTSLGFCANLRQSEKFTLYKHFIHMNDETNTIYVQVGFYLQEIALTISLETPFYS